MILKKWKAEGRASSQSAPRLTVCLVPQVLKHEQNPLSRIGTQNLQQVLLLACADRHHLWSNPRNCGYHPHLWHCIRAGRFCWAAIDTCGYLGAAFHCKFLMSMHPYWWPMAPAQDSSHVHDPSKSLVGSSHHLLSKHGMQEGHTLLALVSPEDIYTAGSIQRHCCILAAHSTCQPSSSAGSIIAR